MTSVLVDDQDAALAFYTEKLGFTKKTDVPLGEGHRWITVVAPEDPDGTELVLEPDRTPRRRRSSARSSRMGSRTTASPSTTWRRSTRA